MLLKNLKSVFFRFRLMNFTIHQHVDKITSGHCCSLLAVTTIKDIYRNTKPYCKNVSLQPLCTEDLLNACSSVYDAKRFIPTEGNNTQTGSDVIEIGSHIMSVCNETKSNVNEDHVGCQVIAAFDACLTQLSGQTIADCR